MRKHSYYLLFLCYSLVILNIMGCQNKNSNNKNSTLDSLQVLNYSALGDSVSMAAQQALMKQLTQAMQSKGAAYAVNFCSERAIPITDSLSNKYNCEIKRVALRNRNPDNALTEEDRIVFDEFAEDLINGVSPKSKVVSQPKTILFYKPIVLGMPACLQCHGKADALNPMAYAAIQSKYPEDQAIDFSLGDLRGMWKLTFTK